MTNTCVRCGRPMPDQAYADSSCARQAADQLHSIADMTHAARDVAHGQTRRGPTGGNATEPRLPLNLSATQRLDEVQAKLTTWIEHITRTRGIPRPWFHTTFTGIDPITAAAQFLTAHIEWVRHRPPAADGQWGAENFLADVEACARIVAGIARGPSAQRYLGPCGAPIPCTCGCGATAYDKHAPDDQAVCNGDIYAREGAQDGACRTCGATVSTRERQAWLNGEVRAHAFRAAHIAEAYGVNVNTIRTWASRPRADTGTPPLASYWRTEAGLITPWIEPPIDPALTGEKRKAREAEIAEELKATRGPRLHYVGDVLDLAAADAARREGERAQRARRAAAKAMGVPATTSPSSATRGSGDRLLDAARSPCNAPGGRNKSA